MPAIDRTLQVMTAVRAALMADAAMALLVGVRVYDIAPEGTVSPYITIGHTNYSDSSTSSSEAQDFSIDIHCFDIPADVSNAPDTSRVRAAMAHIRRVLHDAELSVPGLNLIVCRVIRAISPLPTQDEIHGVTTLRVLIGHE